jgi:hypothetical protein
MLADFVVGFMLSSPVEDEAETTALELNDADQVGTAGWHVRLECRCTVDKMGSGLSSVHRAAALQ